MIIPFNASPISKQNKINLRPDRFSCQAAWQIFLLTMHHFVTMYNWTIDLRLGIGYTSDFCQLFDTTDGTNSERFGLFCELLS